MAGSTEPFSTPPSSSHNDKGHSTTTGLKGKLQKFADGRIVIEAKEILAAVRTDGLNASLTASCKRTQIGDVITVEQDDYSYSGRALPLSTLFLNVSDFPTQIPTGYHATGSRDVTASQFGKNDTEDEGTGTPKMGLVQTNSEVFGASVKTSIMKSLFGPNWDQNGKRLTALAEIYFKDTNRVARVPLVDIGPGESIKAEVDLTWSSDQFLGTTGHASVRYRVLIPS
jgi:hypothetical protein